MISNEKVVENWITQNGVEKGSGSVYAIGKTIYSYGSHFPMATLLDGKTALFTNQGYSRTTSKHLSLVRWALRDEGYKVIEVKLPVPQSGYEYNTGKWVAENVDDLENQKARAKAKERTARSRKPQWQARLKELQRHLSDFIGLVGNRGALALIKR